MLGRHRPASTEAFASVSYSRHQRELLPWLLRSRYTATLLAERTGHRSKFGRRDARLKKLIWRGTNDTRKLAISYLRRLCCIVFLQRMRDCELPGLFAHSGRKLSIATVKRDRTVC